MFISSSIDEVTGTEFGNVYQMQLEHTALSMLIAF